MKKKKKLVPRVLSQKFILINKETVVASTWLRELRGCRVRQVFLSEYELKICFDNGRYLIITDYWELSDKAGVEVDRYMSPQFRKECKLDQLIGQRFDSASKRDLGSAVDLRFLNGMTLTAHYVAVP